MRLAKYNPDAFIDEDLRTLMRLIKETMIKNNDDCVLINVGATGSGKSTLSAHQYSLYSFPEDPDPNKICLTMKDFADLIGELKNYEQPERVIIYDELELSRRSSMTRWNKDVMTLYFKIRGLQCLHIWNHPSLQMIDRAFIQERINGVFFCIDKSTNRPRRYFFFRKKDVLSMLDKYKSLNLEVLKAHGADYAYYMGFYGKFEGKLIDRYKDIKSSGMEDAIKDFQKKYGKNKKKKQKDDSDA